MASIPDASGPLAAGLDPRTQSVVLEVLDDEHTRRMDRLGLTA